jgi:hypothetical protein
LGAVTIGNPLAGVKRVGDTPKSESPRPAAAGTCQRDSTARVVALRAMIDSLNSDGVVPCGFPVVTKIVLVAALTDGEPQMLEPFISGALELK